MELATGIGPVTCRLQGGLSLTLPYYSPLKYYYDLPRKRGLLVFPETVSRLQIPLD